LTETFLTALAVALRIITNPLANVFQKQLTGDGLHPLLVNFLTYVVLAFLCLFIAAAVPWAALPAAFWAYSLLAGMAGAAGNGFLVKALQGGDLSVLGPVNSYKAVVGVIIGIFLLGEVPNVWGVLGILLIIWGSYFVLDTTEDHFSRTLLKRKPIQYRIWAMVLTAMEAVLIKKIILLSSTLAAFISWCGAGALFSFLILILYKVPVRAGVNLTATRNVSRFVFLVLCIGVMQFTTNYAFDHMPVGYALSLFQLSTIVSVLLGYRIFNEQAIRKKLIGSVIMIAGSVILILLK
jgi:drug/metabolite transporter (DMT)-like permease